MPDCIPKPGRFAQRALLSTTYPRVDLLFVHNGSSPVGVKPGFSGAIPRCKSVIVLVPADKGASGKVIHISVHKSLEISGSRLLSITEKKTGGTAPGPVRILDESSGCIGSCGILSAGRSLRKYYPVVTLRGHRYVYPSFGFVSSPWPTKVVRIPSRVISK